MGARTVTTQHSENNKVLGKAKGVEGTQWGPRTSFESGKLQHTSGTPAFGTSVFRAHGQAHSFMHCPWGLQHYKGRLHQLHQSLKYLLPGPSLEKFTDPYPRG